MSDGVGHSKDIDEIWYWYLTGHFRQGLSKRQWAELRLEQTIHSVLPGSPRCIECHVPFAGVGRFVVSRLGVDQSALSHR